MRLKGKPLGILSILDCNFREFTLEDVSLLSAVADQMGLALKALDYENK